MEPDLEINPDTDDLPLRANTNHILVRHYVLNLTVHFEREVISGSVVLFLDPCPGVGTKAEDDVGLKAAEGDGTIEAGRSQQGSVHRLQDGDTVEDGAKIHEFQTLSGVASHTAPETENIQSSHSWEITSDGDFTLVLDCCDLDVSQVEEVDVTSVSAMSSLLPEVSSETPGVSSVNSQAAFIQSLISMPSSQWRQKHQLFLLSSRAAGAQDGSSLHFHRDRWSLQVRKKGVTSPQGFPRALRIYYETKPKGGSVRWTKDQDNRFVSGWEKNELFL